MAERLVDRFFTAESIRDMVDALIEIYPAFEARAFLERVFDAGWEDRALMDRMRYVAECLRGALPEDFREMVGVLEQLGPAVEGFESMALPEIVGRHGLEDWEISMPALAWLTRFGSSEFAIREFLIADAGRAMPWLERWAEDENKHVRRLASEGCRPRLPWGRALRLFGFEEPVGIGVEALALEDVAPAIGGSTYYGFELRLAKGAPSRLRIDLAVDYMKARGMHSRKVFKIAEGEYGAPGRHMLRRKLDFRQRSTRKHYPGEHRLTVLVNGVEMAETGFELGRA